MRGTVILISTAHWHSTWQRHQEFSTGLAASGFAVLFVEPLPKRWPRLREIGRVWGRLAGRPERAGGIRQADPDPVRLISLPLLPDTNALCRSLNRALLPLLARKLIARAPARPRIVLNYLPLAASARLQDLLEPDLAIYDCVWDWPSDPFSRPGVVREGALIERADLILTDAPYLYERMRARHGRVHQLLPAVDFARWAPAREIPAHHERPLCGYFGTIGVNLDLDLLRRLSREFPLRLIGPVDAGVGELGPETELVGPVSLERLPELLADVEVLVLPYRSDGHTQGVIPAKTFECLATGKPTVTIGLPSLEPYGELFVLCEERDGFLEAIPGAAADADRLRQARLAAAQRHDWPARIGQLVDLIEGHLP